MINNNDKTRLKNRARRKGKSDETDTACISSSISSNNIGIFEKGVLSLTRTDERRWKGANELVE